MKEELLFSVTKKDLKIDYFSGTGAGGQHRNKHQNCVRMSHPESGAKATGQSNRERGANEREAFKSLVKHPKFTMWHTQKSMEMLSGETIDQKVEKMMEPKNLKVEGRSQGIIWEDFISPTDEECKGKGTEVNTLGDEL